MKNKILYRTINVLTFYVEVNHERTKERKHEKQEWSDVSEILHFIDIIYLSSQPLAPLHRE